MRLTPLARPLTAVAAAALVVGALTGCTGSALGGGCTPEFQPGDASKAVSVSGEVGATPVITYPTPLLVETAERSVVVPGDGATAVEGSALLVGVTFRDAASDAVVDAVSGLITASDDFLTLGSSLVCANEGSRLVLVGPSSDIWPQAPSEYVVAVIDVLQVFLGKANGVNQLPLDGMPTVVTAVDGTPGIALAYSSAPDEVRVSTVKAGGGATVRDGDTVIRHTRTWSWPRTEGGTPSLGTFDTWAGFQPRPLDALAESDDPAARAVVGAKVGSQLLVVTPGVDGGAATIYVIDILGIIAE